MRPTTWIAMLLALVMVLAACAGAGAALGLADSPGGSSPTFKLRQVQQGQGGATGGVPRPDTVIFEVETSTKSLDQAQLYDPYAVLVAWNVYETLLWYDGSGMEPIPWLAERYEVSPDGLRYTFTLREGIRFHDGTPLDAEAVRFSIYRIIEMAQPRGGFNYYIGVLKGVAQYAESKKTPEDVQALLDAGGIEVLDARTVRFNLERPYPAFPHMMALGFISAIISPRAVQENGGVEPAKTNPYFDSHMVGTGPYRLVSFDVGSGTALLQAYEGYWGGPKGDIQPKVRNVLIRVVADPLTRVLNLKSGQSDMAIIGPTELFQFADEDRWRTERQLVSTVPGVTVRGPFLLNRIEAIGMNAQIMGPDGKPQAFQPFADERVRRAFIHAFDREAYINQVLKGFGEPISTPVPRGWIGYSQVPLLPFDLAEAKALLEQAGPSVGFSKDNPQKLTFVYPSGEKETEAALLMLASNINSLDVGLHIDVEPLAYPAFVSQYLKRQLAVLRISWVGSFPDPDANLQAFAYGKTGLLATKLGFNDPQVNKLIEQQAVELDTKKRAALIQEAARRINNQHFYIWRAQRTDYFIHRDWIKGYYHHRAVVGPYFAALRKGA